MLAVFRCRVPKDQSHYSMAFHGLSSATGDTEQVTGYPGQVAIDPVRGTILRLAVQADQPLGCPILRAEIMVEYGRVEIGDKTFMCPGRSVSISLQGMGLIDPLSRSAPTPEPTC